MKELKDLLKPPFVCLSNSRVIDKSKHFCVTSHFFNDHFQLDNCIELTKEWHKFICEALNEKIGRERGERKHWIRTDVACKLGQVILFNCPVCNKRGGGTNYCPNCGMRLELPEEKT